MSKKTDIKTFGKIYQYPDGTYDIMGADHSTFSEAGWEERDKKPTQRPQGRKESSDPEDIERAKRRARAHVRRLALANDFKYFVTLTIDPQKVDSFDTALVIKRLQQWCSNQVKRKGLAYILVPEFHKSGRIHFHGFFNDALTAVDSGHKDKEGHTIYNLPGWSYGFTTAIELYGERRAAIGYTVKYIGKDSSKIGGRWYYSGGDLQEPVEKYVEISARDIIEQYGDRAWVKYTPGGVYAGVNGVSDIDNGVPAE